MTTSAILSAAAPCARGPRVARHRVLRVLGSLSLLVAGTALAADAKTSHPKEYRVDAAHGSDSRSGSASAPWKSIERANRAAPGSIVRVAAGTYDDAPTAPGVTFIGAEGSDPRERIVTDEVELSGAGTTIKGFTLAKGLDFEDAARGNVIDRCVIRDHWGMWGGERHAPRNNWIKRSRLTVNEIAAHTHGDDRDRTVPRIVGPLLADCDVTVRRSGGVLWRWSGVDDANIVRTKIRLVNGGKHNDDDASWKWFYVRRARITDSHIVLDHAADFGETGPFAPMWRDSTWGTRVTRTTIEALRGGMIFSPNTAGTWICSCGGNRFEDVTLRAPGTIYFYQCPITSDTWVRSKIYAGHLDEYNIGKMPKSLAVRSFAAPTK